MNYDWDEVVVFINIGPTISPTLPGGELFKFVTRPISAELHFPTLEYSQSLISRKQRHRYPAHRIPSRAAATNRPQHGQIINCGSTQLRCPQWYLTTTPDCPSDFGLLTGDYHRCPDSATTLLLAPQDELTRLTAELATERTISTRLLKERDEAVLAARVELARLSAELVTEKAISARLLQPRDGSARQHVQLSLYIGEYTSAFLDSKTCCERAALLASIRVATKMVWDSGTGMPFETTLKMVRVMLAEYGFVFREPGEGETGWGGYSMMVPDVPVREQLDRVVRTHRVKLGEDLWYFTELVTVMYRIVKYLEENI